MGRREFLRDSLIIMKSLYRAQQSERSIGVKKTELTRDLQQRNTQK